VAGFWSYQGSSNGQKDPAKAFNRTKAAVNQHAETHHRKDINMSKNPKPPVVLSTTQLRKLCDQALALKFSNGPNERFWREVDPSGVHVVGPWFVHRPRLAFWNGVDHPWDFTHGGGKNIRALVLCKMRGEPKPTELLCDFDYEAFMALVQDARQQALAG
jgi:hypothetical protein